jgi:hypothetical protein
LIRRSPAAVVLVATVVAVVATVVVGRSVVVLAVEVVSTVEAVVATVEGVEVDPESAQATTPTTATARIKEVLRRMVDEARAAVRSSGIPYLAPMRRVRRLIRPSPAGKGESYDEVRLENRSRDEQVDCAGPPPPSPGAGVGSDLLSQEEVKVKKVLLILTVIGIGFLAWRYFSNEPI